MRCPAELYRDSTRRYSRAEVQLSYPGMVTRLVDKSGKLSWKDQKVFLTGSLALLGHLDPLDLSFVRADTSPHGTESTTLTVN
jgi:hypothetical protein